MALDILVAGQESQNVFVVLFFIELSMRKVEIGGIASAATGLWMSQIGRKSDRKPTVFMVAECDSEEEATEGLAKVQRDLREATCWLVPGCYILATAPGFDTSKRWFVWSYHSEALICARIP